MTELLGKFLSWAKDLWLKTRFGVSGYGYLTHRIDGDSLARLFRVDEKLPLGENEHPACPAEIAHFCDELLRKGLSRLEHQHSAVARLARNLDIPSEVSLLSTWTRTTEKRVNAVKEAAEMGLSQALERGAEAEEGYNEFKLKNELTRPARLPQLRPVYFGFILVLAATLTVFIAGLMHNNYSVNALVRAMPLALAFSLVPAVAGALGIRFVNHVNGLLMLAGLVVAVLAIHTLVVLAMTVADPVLLAQVSLTTWNTDVATLLAEPSSLIAVATTREVAVLVLAGVSATVAGYAMDDSYPQYGSVHRDMVAMQDKYASLVNNLQSKVAGIYRGDLNRLIRRRNKTHRAFTRFSKELSKFDRSCRQFDSYRQSVTNVGTSLLDRRGFAIDHEVTAYARYEPIYKDSSNLANSNERGSWLGLHLQMKELQQAFEASKQQLMALETNNSNRTDSLTETLIVPEAQPTPIRSERKKPLSGFQPNRSKSAVG